VQARAGGAVSGGLTELRALLRATQNVRIYRPSTSDDRAWAAAAERVGLT